MACYTGQFGLFIVFFNLAHLRAGFKGMVPPWSERTHTGFKKESQTH